MDEHQQRLFTLLELAEQQAAAVNAALGSFQAERVGLGQTIMAAKESALAMSSAATAAEAAARSIGPIVNTLARDAIAEAGRQWSREALDKFADAAERAASAGTRPVTEKLTDAADAADDAAAALAKAARSFGWKLAAGWAVSLLVVFGSAWVMSARQRSQIDELDQQRALLANQIAAAQTNLAELERRGGKVKLERCGDAGRLCVRVDDRPGRFGQHNEYAVLSGY